MEFRILGPLEIHHNGAHINLTAPKQRTLLSVMLCHANRPVANEALIEALWETDPPPSAGDNLRVYVSQLRRALGDEQWIIRHRLGYVLTVYPGELDAQRFEELVHRGRGALAAGDPLGASALLAQAVALWRGPAFADVERVNGVNEAAARLDEHRLATLEERIDADFAWGRHGELIAELRGLVAEHPLRERLHVRLMLALYRSGRQAEALDVYRAARKLLVDELGIEPGPELRQMESAILNADPALGSPARFAAPAVGHPPGVATATSRRTATRIASWVWCLIPLMSVGFLTPFAFAYAFARRRTLALGLATGVYVGSLVLAFALPVTDPEVAAYPATLSDWLFDIALTVSTVGGTMHAIIVRSRVFGLTRDSG